MTGASVRLSLSVVVFRLMPLPTLCTGVVAVALMRTMHATAKWVFYILAVSFVAWLAIGQVISILGPSGNVVLRVHGSEYQVNEYPQRAQAASAQYPPQ